MQLLYWETIDEDSDHAKVYRFYLDNIYQNFDLLIIIIKFFTLINDCSLFNLIYVSCW